jgi:hypothetical protein
MSANFFLPYFIGSLYFLIIWLVLFFFNKNDRKEQWIMSLFGVVLGPIAQEMHLVDWWNPQFFHDSLIHIEDIIFGFSVVGISGIIYDVIFVKKLRKLKKLRVKTSYFLTSFIIAVFSLFGLFFIFGIASFITNIIAALIMFVFITIKRHDLVSSMLITGVILTLISIPAYLIGLAIDPNWITSQWYLDNLSGVMFIGIPVEEFAWFFTVGIGASALYEFAYGIKLVKKKR